MPPPPESAVLPVTMLRRCLAEGLGTAFLTLVVIGSGIAATRLAPDEPGMQLLVNSVATGAALMALILAFGAISAAFNPIVTIVDALLGGLRWYTATVVVIVQVGAAVVGAILANLMFGLAPAELSARERGGTSLWLAEVIATLGLLVMIFSTQRAGGHRAVAVAVGGYITAAYWFTSSTSFANPALIIGRMLSDSFAGIAPGSVPLFLIMQVIGGAVAVPVIRVLWPVERKEPHVRNFEAERPVHVRAQRGSIANGGRLPPRVRG